MKFLLFIFIFFLLVSPAYVLAGDIDLVVEKRGGNVFEVAVLLVPTDLPINAVEGILSLPETARVQEIRTGESVVGLWVEGPHRDNQEILFSGVIPGGFSGLAFPDTSVKGPGLVFSVLFEDTEGEGTLSTSDVFLYPHDGSGIPERGVSDRVSYGEDTVLFLDRPKDTTRPLIIEARIVEEDALAEGSPTLIFTAIDKESGVARAEIRFGSDNWQEITSPFVLPQEKIGKTLTIRIIDGAGNVAQTVVFRSVADMLTLGIGLSALLIVVLWLLFRFTWRSRF